ncbi:hypothetical protein CAPTEDRAFT_212987 [Capitella teleta]|uniref:Uncharacterized protein n=1 Tax=Capitella teleta TaxID=283909 RepID=R7TTP1_CAPTE|nr:hypothetical protein CAPTEDRAFT_212987 [Capitella teleta]|eukprot:ELT94806.1 hypothetical protein CAPTEDRAFT_212987 [Capitella teleta]
MVQREADNALNRELATIELAVNLVEEAMTNQQAVFGCTVPVFNLRQVFRFENPTPTQLDNYQPELELELALVSPAMKLGILVMKALKRSDRPDHVQTSQSTIKDSIVKNQAIMPGIVNDHGGHAHQLPDRETNMVCSGWATYYSTNPLWFHDVAHDVALDTALDVPQASRPALDQIALGCQVRVLSPSRQAGCCTAFDSVSFFCWLCSLRQENQPARTPLPARAPAMLVSSSLPRHVPAPTQARGRCPFAHMRSRSFYCQLWLGLLVDVRMANYCYSGYWDELELKPLTPDARVYLSIGFHPSLADSHSVAVGEVGVPTSHFQGNALGGPGIAEAGCCPLQGV